MGSRPLHGARGVLDLACRQLHHMSGSLPFVLSLAIAILTVLNSDRVLCDEDSMAAAVPRSGHTQEMLPEGSDELTKSTAALASLPITADVDKEASCSCITSCIQCTKASCAWDSDIDACHPRTETGALRIPLTSVRTLASASCPVESSLLSRRLLVGFEAEREALTMLYR